MDKCPPLSVNLSARQTNTAIAVLSNSNEFLMNMISLRTSGILMIKGVISNHHARVQATDHIQMTIR
jgi:hypothetical protein